MFLAVVRPADLADLDKLALLILLPSLPSCILSPNLSRAGLSLSQAVCPPTTSYPASKAREILMEVRAELLLSVVEI